MKMTRRLLALLLAFCLTFGNVMPAMATELAAEEPVATEEPVVVPEVEETEAPAKEPEVTEAPVVEPEVTEAPVVEPEVTEAPVVEPEVTEAPVVEPEVTEAPVVEPEVTEAPVVEPEVTEAPVVEEPEAPVVEVEEVEPEGVDLPEGAVAVFTFPDGNTGEFKEASSTAIGATKTYAATAGSGSLVLTNCDRVYDSGWDLNNKGYIKLGGSSNTGTLTFAVPDEVTSVELHLAKYKAKTSKYTINGGEENTLTNSVNDGAWHEVTVDTSATKSITLATVSGAPRIILYAVIFYGGESGGEDPDPTPDPDPDPTPDPDPEEPTIADGVYVISSGDKALAALASDANYGYAPADSATGYSTAAAMTITNVDGGFTIQDCYGRYMYMSGSYNSFNVSADVPAEGHIWKLTTESYLLNVLKNKTVAYTANYGTWGAYSDQSSAVTFTAYVEPVDPDPVADTELSIADAIALGQKKASGVYTVGKYYITGEITEIQNTTHGNMIISDGTDSILIYGTYEHGGKNKYEAMSTQPVVGDTIVVYGVIGNYNGTSQMKNGWIEERAIEEPEADSELSIADAIALGKENVHNDYTEGKYYVTGTISEVYDPAHGNMYITDGEGNTLTVYGSYSADGETKYSEMTDKPVAGYTVTVYGIIGQYNGTAQMKNAWITESIAPLGSEANPIDLTTDLLYEDDLTATVTVPAGKTYYYMAYRLGGILMTIDDGEAVACPGDPSPMAPPYVWSIANNSEADEEHVITLSYPAGSSNNPAELELGENVAEIAAGAQGYNYTWTAEEDGVLTVELVTESGWIYQLDNVTGGKYGDMQWSDSDPIVNPATIAVAKGDIVKLMVNTYDPQNPYSAPAGSITVNASFAKYIAKIGEVGFTSLQAALDASVEGDVIELLCDIKMDAGVKNKGTAVLDLKGFTITGTDTTSKNFGLIDNVGNLTIKDSVGGGKILLTATTNSGWSRYSAVLSNNPGGHLTVEGGHIEHLGGTDMAYGIDNLTNGTGTYAEVTINGGTIKSTYRGIRQFLNGVEAQNILTINGGTIEGGNKSVWMQDPSAKANTGKLTVSEKATLIGDVYLYVTAGSTEWPVEVSIAGAAMAEGSKVTTGNVPAGYDLSSTDGNYSVLDNVVVKIGDTYYDTLEDALDAAQAGDTINLLDDATLTEDFIVTNDLTITASKAVTITTNGATDAFTVTGGTLTLGANITIKSNTSVLWANGGDIVVDGTVIEATNSPYAVCLANSGSVLTVKSGTISHIGGNQSTVCASGADAIVNIEDGNIISGDSSAVLAKNGGIVNISGGVVETTCEDPEFCAAFATSGGVINVTGGEIKAAANPGIIAAIGGAVNVSGGTVNGVVAHGGTSASATITGGIINGDVIVMDGAAMTITGGTFESDVSALLGDDCVQNEDGTVGYVPGHEKNPIDLTADLLYEEDFSATVTVPAGKTMHYIAYRVGGMLMFINDGEPAECTTDGMMMPYAWSITNDGEVDADYFITVEYPVGHPSNPMELAVDTEEGMKWNSYCGIEPNSMNGFAYRWTADKAGELTITVNNGVAGWSYFVTVTDYSDPENPISKQTDIRYSCDIPVLNSETVVVKAGDVVDLVVNTCGANPEIIPGGQVVVTTSFVRTITEDYPLEISGEAWDWNEDGTEKYAWVTVPANTTYYFQTYLRGTWLLTINDGEPTEVKGSNYEPVVFAVENTTKKDAEFLVRFSQYSPVGSMENPAELELGETVVTVEEGTEGYYYTYTAKADGTLTFTISAEPGWFYVINNMTTNQYGDEQNSDGNPVANPATIEVSRGDEIRIQVNTYDSDAPWYAPAGEVTVTLAAEYDFAPGEDASVPEILNMQGLENGDVYRSNNILRGETFYYQIPALGTDLNLRAFGDDVIMTVNGTEYKLTTEKTVEIDLKKDPRNPVNITFTLPEDSEYDGSFFEFGIGYVRGSMDAPVYMKIGKNSVKLTADRPEYHYIYQPSELGFLTVTMNTEKNWVYGIDIFDINMGEEGEWIYGDSQIYGSGGKKSQTIAVNPGMTVYVHVATKNAQAGTISFTAAKAAKELSVVTGKTKTLTFTNPANGKKVDADDVKWEIINFWGSDISEEAVASDFATISKKGVLTAKPGITKAVTVQIRAALKKNAEVENYFQVTIRPKATEIQIDQIVWQDGNDSVVENINGKTIDWCINGGEDYHFVAIVSPEDAIADVTWKSSNTKIVKIDEHGNLQSVATKSGAPASGTVTITATAKDGSGAKASFSLNVFWLARELEIAPKNGLWTIGSGVSVPMIANVDRNATNKAVTWSVTAGYSEFDMETSEEKWYDAEGVVSIDENGVLTVAETLDRAYDVIVTATAKDGGGAKASCGLTIIPGVVSINVDEVPTTYDLNSGDVMYPGAYGVTATGDRAESGLKWTSSNKKIAKVTEWGEIEFTGKTGTVKLTATTTDGTNIKKTVTVKVVKSPTSVTLSKHEATLAAGKSLTLKVTVGPKSATSKSYTWDVKYYQFTYETQETIELSAETVKAMGIKFSKGKFTVDSKKFNKYYNALESEAQIWAEVTATAKMAQPGYWEWNEELQEDVYVPVYAEDYGYVTFAPATKKIAIVQHNKVEDGQVVTGKTLKVDTEGVVVLTAQPTPTTAGYMYTWKSSNTKIAKVAQNPDGSVSVIPTGKKTGTVTITAKAADGSGKYAKVKVKVIQKVDEIKLDNSKFILSGAATKKGRTFDLNKLATIAPAKATYKTLKWYIAAWDAELAAANKITVSSSGTLTAKMNVTEPVSISVVAQATDGYPAIAVTKVTITPATTKVIIVDTEGAEVTTTQSVKVKSTLTFGAKSEGEDAADLFTWKSSNTKYAKVVANADGTVTVTGVKKGTVTITATAKDGSGVKDTIKVKVVK